MIHQLDLRPLAIGFLSVDTVRMVLPAEGSP